jgi:hypothetical protein
MNTKLNLWKDKKIEMDLRKEEISQEMILSQTKKCEEDFDIWQTCIKTKSWNDEQCIGQLKPNYELCIAKRNLMQTLFEKRIDESNDEY